MNLWPVAAVLIASSAATAEDSPHWGSSIGVKPDRQPPSKEEQAPPGWRAIPGWAPGVAERVREVRENQRLLQEATGVVLRTFDRPGVSGTFVESVPPEIAGMIVLDESDIEEVVQLLAPYYGLGDREELRLQERSYQGKKTNYLCVEWFNGIQSSVRLSILVDSESRHVIRLEGGVLLDTGFDSGHLYNEEEAIEAVKRFVKRRKSRFISVRLEGNHRAVKLYRPFGKPMKMMVWWLVLMEQPRSASVAGKAGSMPTEPFYVDPNGSVTSLKEEALKNITY